MENYLKFCLLLIEEKSGTAILNKKLGEFKIKPKGFY